MFFAQSWLPSQLTVTSHGSSIARTCLFESSLEFFFLLVQAVASSPSSSPVTPRGTTSFKSLVERVKGVGLGVGGLDTAEMQSPNKIKYSRSESRGAGLRIADHPVGERTYTPFHPSALHRYMTLED